VTYIIERLTSMAALFHILALSLYARSALSRDSRSSPVYYALSLAVTVLAMFTRESAVIIPVAMAVYDIIFLERGGMARWRRLAPFLATMLIMPATMMLTSSMSWVRDGTSGISPAEYIFTEPRTMATYLRLLVLPVNQNIDHDYPLSKGLFEAPVLSSLALLLALFALAVSSYKRSRLTSFAVFWIFLTIPAESCLIKPDNVIFEHRLYLSMAAFSILLVSAVYQAFGKKGMGPAIAALSVIVIAYSTLAYSRNSLWKDEVALWEDAVRKSPNKARPYNNKGNAYQRKGEFAQAIADYNRALGIDPRYAEAYNNRGNIYLTEGDLDRAISDFNKALEIKPGYDNACYNRALAYQNKGDPDRALADYSRAVTINPSYSAAYYNRGLVYQAKGDLDRAISDYGRVLQINRGYGRAYNNRGCCYQNKGDLDRAISDFDGALAADPGYADAYYNRGLAYQMKGDLDQAIADYTKALEINPALARGYNNRAVVYGQKKEYDKAWADVRRAQALGGKPNPTLVMNLKKASGRDE
jgi:tetratricopeptide (TPR) repeat protein